MRGGPSLLLDESGATLLAAPLVGEHATVGAVVLAGDGEGRFDRDDVRLLEVMAHVAGLAFQNAVLHEQAAEERARTQVLLDLARELAHTATPDSIGEALTRAVVDRVPCDRCTLWLYEDGDSVRCGVAGPAAHDAGAERYQRDRSLESERRLARGETVVVSAESARAAAWEPAIRRPSAAEVPGAAARRAGRARSACCGSRAGPSARPSSRCSRAWRCRPRSRSTASASQASSRRASWPRSTPSCVRSRHRTCTRRATRSRSPTSLAAWDGCSGSTPSRCAMSSTRQCCTTSARSASPRSCCASRGRSARESASTCARTPRSARASSSRSSASGSSAPLVRFSHECWDGSGYPDGLAGEQIPLGARIISVCDAFDAMVSDRPYRGGRSAAEALAELREHAGTQFDPAVVEAFEQAVRDHRSAA